MICRLLVILILLVPTWAWGETLYVRPLEGEYPNDAGEDGLTYATAFDGFSDIAWGAGVGSVGPGDTLIACGDFTLEILNVGADGTEGAGVITITGECTDAGGTDATIDGSADLKSATWVNDSGNIYYTETTYTNYLLLDDKFAMWEDAKVDLTANGEWFYDAAPTPDRVYLYDSGGSPDVSTTYATIRQASSSYERGIYVNSYDYITIKNFTIKRIETKCNAYSEGANDAAILVDDSDYVTVENNTLSQNGHGIFFYGGSDYATIRNNTIIQTAKFDSGTYDDFRYGRAIWFSGNNASIYGNVINNRLTLWDDSYENGGYGIRGEQQVYPDNYCLNAHIYNNTVEYVAWSGISIQQYCTGMGTDRAVGIIIEHNTVKHGLDGYGTEADGEEDGIALGCNAGDESNYFTGAIIRYNWVEDWVNTGIINANYWEDTQIYYNVIIDTPYGVYNKNKNYIYNNTILDSSWDGIVVYTPNITGSIGAVIKNNIIYNVDIGDTGHGKAVYVAVTADNATGGWNCVYDIEGDPDFTNFTNTSGVAADPLFASYASKLLRLTTLSPCKDVGTSVGLTLDHANIPVPQGALPDIGAYEVFSYCTSGGVED